MAEIRSKCEGCGMCCRAIYLPIKHSEMVSDMDKFKANRTRERIQYEPDYKVSEKMDDKTFVIQNWYPLTKEEVMQRNPFLIETWKLKYDMTEEEIDVLFNTHFYGCSQLNEETGRCMTHDNLAKVCSEYPWYGKRPDITHGFYTEDCYYKRDVTPEALEEYDQSHKIENEKDIDKEVTLEV